MPEPRTNAPGSGGRVFSGRYELVRLIARGGMAEVYLAHDLLLDRPIALKVLFAELSTDPAFVERFRREAQAAANLTHPNIVSIYDTGVEGGTYFIVMELIDGRTLSQVLTDEGPFNAERAAEVGAEVAAALAFAHRGGVVHRDVKPGNVLIDAHGRIKVTDFGIAHASGVDQGLTQAGSVMGTATYFSPEQAQGKTVDARSDVYSLGVMLYEMVTGRPPFTADNPVAMAYLHVREEPDPPRQLEPSVPPAFENIVLQCMAKDPRARYQDAESLRLDLIRFRQGRAVTAEPPATMAVPVAAPAPPAGQTTTRRVTQEPATIAYRPGGPAGPGGGGGRDITPVEPHRRVGPYVAVTIVLLAVLAILLFLLGRTLGVFGSAPPAAQVVVPNVIGSDADAAARQLRDGGLTVTLKEEASEAPAGTVFDQDPKGDTRVARGAPVTLFVSRGETNVSVPDITGETVGEARRILEAAGFQVSEQETASEDVPPGVVISQDPLGEAEAPKGSTVMIVVSSGKPNVSVPDVTNLTEVQAARRLGQEGFEVTTDREPSDTVEEGHVIRTDPEAGTEVEMGTEVRMVVSSGPAEPQTATVPDVIGMTEDEARSALTNAGFRVRSSEVGVANPADEDRVVDQNPRGGRDAPVGSTVTIVIGRSSLDVCRYGNSNSDKAHRRGTGRPKSRRTVSSAHLGT